MAAGDADARPQSAPAGSKAGGGRGGRSAKGRKNKRGKRGGRGGKGSGGGGGSGPAGEPQAQQDSSPLPVAEARLAAADCFGAHTAAKERAVRAWCTAEFADEHVSDCGCFAWEIEKCRAVRTVPQWDADTENVVACSIVLPAALRRSGKPFAVLAEGALVSAEGASEFAKAMEAESQQTLNDLFVALYQNVQSHALRVNEFCTLIDLIGHKRRREIQLGPILRSINSRSCPAAVARKSFEIISSQAYCQICHRVGVENGVSRCGDCGVVAYCSKRHAQLDHVRHQSWCKELQFSRVLQTALPWSSYVDTSRRLLMPYTPTSMLVRRLGDGSGQQARPLALPAGWRQFFELHRDSRADSRSDDGDAHSGRNHASSGDQPNAALHVFDEVLATDALSSVLTVAYALTKLGFASEPTPTGERKRLCLHLLGADHERELPWPELFSWVPHVEIAIVLIGPHTPTMAEREIDTKGTKVPPGRKMTVQGVAGCFHELSTGVLLALPKADAVFALNSGLIFYPSWADTVDRVLDTGSAPFVVSAWAQPEALGVRQMLFDSQSMPLSEQVRVAVPNLPSALACVIQVVSLATQEFLAAPSSYGLHPLRQRLYACVGWRLLQIRQGMDLHSNPFASLVPQAVMDDHGTCNFNNRYLLAVARENSHAMRRCSGTSVPELQEVQSQSDSAALSKLSLEQTGSEDKQTVVAKAESSQATGK